MSSKIDHLLDQLDELKGRFDVSANEKLLRLLTRLKQTNFPTAESLIRFHEILLFVRAYPRNARLLTLTESILSSFPERVATLEEAGIDTSAFFSPEISGIAGTFVSDTFSYYIVRWLSRKHPAQICFDWDWFEDENRLAETLPRFMPLLEEDASVEANVPYVIWLRAARNGKSEITWLIERFEHLPLSDEAKAELYDSQQLYVRWRPAYSASRTGMRLGSQTFFYHRNPLISRRDISFIDELLQPAPEILHLSRMEGRRILDMARETSTVRYRELYGFTHGDEARVLYTNVGRGVELFICGLPPERRLPVRAYHAAMIFKNSVPVGYFEGLSLFERMESGFNFYYSFREGETAWIYAKTLNVLRHLLGVTAFYIDPYQIGHENEEGIESGAFWFYRKLGFRPVRRDLQSLTEKEEEQIARRKTYRTPPTVLRRLAEGGMILELNKTLEGDWDRFSVRNIGLQVQQRMASRYQGNSELMRQKCVHEISETLRIRQNVWNEPELRALNHLALVLNMIPDLKSWTKDEQEQLVRVVRAKASSDEANYLKLMQRHARLRRSSIKLGS